jgi:hypothetical protein
LRLLVEEHCTTRVLFRHFPMISRRSPIGPFA